MALDQKIHYLEGALFNIRFACSRKHKQAKEAKILKEKRQVHVKGVKRTTFPKSILRYLKNFGEVLEFIFIPNNSAGEISCFAVFDRKGISDELHGHEFSFKDSDQIYTLVRPLSPNELLEKKELKRSSSSQIPSSNMLPESEDRITNPDQHRFNLGRGRDSNKRVYIWFEKGLEGDNDIKVHSAHKGTGSLPQW